MVGICFIRILNELIYFILKIKYVRIVLKGENMEYFDVLDNNRKKRGYTKIRGEKLNENEYNVGVEIWIFNNNKLLLTQRSPQKSHPLMWEVPGGCSQASETSVQTLKREIKEEIGVNLNDDFNLLDTQLRKQQFIDIYTTNQIIKIVTLQKEEVSDYKFVTKDEFNKMINDNEIVPAIIDRYNMIKNRVLW